MMDYYCVGCGALNADYIDSAPLIYCWQCHGTGFTTEAPEAREDSGITADEDEDRAKGRFRGPEPIFGIRTGGKNMPTTIEFP